MLCKQAGKIPILFTHMFLSWKWEIVDKKIAFIFLHVANLVESSETQYNCIWKNTPKGGVEIVEECDRCTKQDKKIDNDTPFIYHKMHIGPKNTSFLATQLSAKRRTFIPLFFLVFCTNFNFNGDALGTHRGRIGDALGRLWGRIGDALRTHWGGFRDALGTHWGRIGDTLGTH